MTVGGMCAYALVVCLSPRCAVCPSRAVCVGLQGFARAWQHPCVRAIVPARPYVCGLCKRESENEVWHHLHPLLG